MWCCSPRRIMEVCFKTHSPSNRAGWNVGLISSQLQSSGSLELLANTYPYLVRHCTMTLLSHNVSLPVTHPYSSRILCLVIKYCTQLCFLRTSHLLPWGWNVLSLETSLQAIKMSVSFSNKYCALCNPCPLIPTFFCKYFCSKEDWLVKQNGKKEVHSISSWCSSVYLFPCTRK